MVSGKFRIEKQHFKEKSTEEITAYYEKLQQDVANLARQIIL